MINTKETIEACINYIENNIHRKISLDDIALYVGVSKYYLHRMFKALTGESIIEYVQARKLSASINELANTNMRMLDIALEYGFDHEQSYIRAFKKKFGYTPLKARTEQISIEIKEKMNINDILSVHNSIIYKPFYIFKQKFNLIGKKYKILSRSGDNIANMHGRDFFYHHSHEIRNGVNPQVYFGYTDWSEYNDGHIYYIPSIQVADVRHIPEGMTSVHIPPHKYVVFRFVGFFRPDDIKGRQVGRLLVHLYRKWIVNSGFQSADTFRFEYIDTRRANDNYCELDIYQPIKEAGSTL
ncbi:AraC family transcriptional regulator [Geosporobacter ferrireducens]|uniref:AraC family transcriptional regulator n=1 Tax=Geosporobacter ferrireducens TaxID=1424294 RepID=A0A1D8GG91_9FIRM|nr:AraC family transcriptional regulator [Geosporobacter ferrireducens]AOT69913.1 AraC family transcriptional regulator [Geosporobacter ferrireducens]